MEPKHIVIAGAGFGGITAALTLAKQQKKLGDSHRITLINRNNNQLYTPALYEIASAPRESTPNKSLKSSILIPLADIIRGTSIEFIVDEVIAIDHTKKTLTLKQRGLLPYEFLVLALGSETNYFAVRGLAEFSRPLKSFSDAVRLRNDLENLVKQKEKIKVVVGGAGASGVELVAEFVNFTCALQTVIPGRKKCNVEFLLVEAAAEILPGFEHVIIAQARKRLQQLGIVVKTNTMITEVQKDKILYKDGFKESYDILIWTGGIKGSSLLQQLGVPLSNKGMAEINEFLQIKGAEDRLFAIGDNSTMLNPKTGKPLIWNVPVAESEGRLAAGNIVRIIASKPLKPFVPLAKYPFVLAVGKKYAIADLIFIRFSGLLGWAIKQLVELRYLFFILPPQKALRTWLRSISVADMND